MGDVEPQSSSIFIFFKRTPVIIKLLIVITIV